MWTIILKVIERTLSSSGTAVAKSPFELLDVFPLY